MVYSGLHTERNGVSKGARIGSIAVIVKYSPFGAFFLGDVILHGTETILEFIAGEFFRKSLVTIRSKPK
jgi:hypothetical protein